MAQTHTLIISRVENNNSSVNFHSLCPRLTGDRSISIVPYAKVLQLTSCTNICAVRSSASLKASSPASWSWSSRLRLLPTADAFPFPSPSSESEVTGDAFLSPLSLLGSKVSVCQQRSAKFEANELTFKSHGGVDASGPILILAISSFCFVCFRDVPHPETWQ